MNIDESTLAEMAADVYLDPSGFAGKSVFDRFKTFAVQDSGTEAVIAFKGRTAIVVFRGTEVNSLIDIFADIAFLRTEQSLFGYVHRGFLRAFNRVAASVFGSLDRLDQSHRLERVIFCGHSLGGAIATIAAERATDVFDPNCKIDLVTFGSPRVGVESWSESVRMAIESTGGQVIRIVHQNDIVPRVPFGGFEFKSWWWKPLRWVKRMFPAYRHVGGPIVFHADGTPVRMPTNWELRAIRLTALMQGCFKSMFTNHTMRRTSDAKPPGYLDTIETEVGRRKENGVTPLYQVTL